MNNFAQFKEGMLASVGKSFFPCKDGYAQFLKAASFNDVGRMIKESFAWCINNKLLTAEVIKKYEEECNQADIYCNQNVNSAFCLVTSNTEIDAYGHSFVYVLGNGIVNAYDSTFVIATDNAEVHAYDLTTVQAKNNSEVIANDYTTVEADDETHVFANFKSYIITLSDQVKVERAENAKVVNE